jgi:hypothetical protein
MKYVKNFFTKEVLIASIIFFIIGYRLSTYNFFKIGSEYETIVVTVDRQFDYGSEYLLDNYIKTRDNYLNIEVLIDDVITNNEDICINENKYIKINDNYYNICGNSKKEVSKYDNIIEEYEEIYDARISEMYYKKIK